MKPILLVLIFAAACSSQGCRRTALYQEKELGYLPNKAGGCTIDGFSDVQFALPWKPRADSRCYLSDAKFMTDSDALSYASELWYWQAVQDEKLKVKLR